MAATDPEWLKAWPARVVDFDLPSLGVCWRSPRWTRHSRASTYGYTPYGLVTHTGVATPLQYTGQYSDSETGLLYLRARYYDPSTALFLTVDPLVGTTRTPYSYSGGNPVNYTDPTELSRWSGIAAGFAVAGAVIGVGACIVLEPCGATMAVVGGYSAVVFCSPQAHSARQPAWVSVAHMPHRSPADAAVPVNSIDVENPNPGGRPVSRPPDTARHRWQTLTAEVYG
jgi:RHS repeat-associated protein